MVDILDVPVASLQLAGFTRPSSVHHVHSRLCEISQLLSDDGILTPMPRLKLHLYFIGYRDSPSSLSAASQVPGAWKIVADQFLVNLTGLQ